MELEINKQILADEDQLNKVFNKLKTIINYIASFKIEPDNVAEKIAQDPELGLADAFKDVKAGLLGEFTRAQTIDIGINKLITCLTTAIEEFKSLTDKLSLSNYITNLKKEVNGYMDAIIKNVNPDMLYRRKERYLENSLTKEFFTKRCTNVLTSKIGEFGTAKLPRDILFSFREIVSMINLCETSQLEEIGKDIKTRKEFTSAMYGRIGQQDFNKETLVPKVQPEELRARSILDYYIEKINSNDTPVTEIEVVNGFIDNLERYLTGFKDNLDHISQVLASITNDNALMEQVLVDIVSNLVLPLTQNTITKEEFSSKLNDSLITIQNLLVVSKDLRTIILNTYIHFINNLDVFNIIYSTIDEITFAGTLKETGEVNKEPILNNESLSLEYSNTGEILKLGIPILNLFTLGWRAITDKTYISVRRPDLLIMPLLNSPFGRSRANQLFAKDGKVDEKSLSKDTRSLVMNLFLNDSEAVNAYYRILVKYTQVDLNEVTKNKQMVERFKNSIKELKSKICKPMEERKASQFGGELVMLKSFRPDKAAKEMQEALEFYKQRSKKMFDVASDLVKFVNKEIIEYLSKHIRTK